MATKYSTGQYRMKDEVFKIRFQLLVSRVLYVRNIASCQERSCTKKMHNYMSLFVPSHKLEYSGIFPVFKALLIIKIQGLWLKFCKTLVRRYAPTSYKNLQHLRHSFFIWLHKPSSSKDLVATLWRYQKFIYKTLIEQKKAVWCKNIMMTL